MENETPENNSMPETSPAQSNAGMVRRPWQGTTMYVLSIIGAVFLGIAMLAFIALMLGGSVAAGTEAAGLFGFFAALGAIMIVPLALFLVLSIFMARGFAKGQRWAPILSAILQGLSVLGTLANQDFASVVLPAFFLYLSVVCIKHPYYNQH